MDHGNNLKRFFGAGISSAGGRNKMHSAATERKLCAEKRPAKNDAVELVRLISGKKANAAL
jgi:hypothetical protein